MLQGLSLAAILLMGPVALVAFAATEELFWLRASYWLTVAGLATAFFIWSLGLLDWALMPGTASLTGLRAWRAITHMSVAAMYAAAWVGLGGTSGEPTTAGRDITVALVAQCIGTSLLLMLPKGDR